MVSSRAVLLGVIGLLLVGSVAGANVVIAGQRTVLDADFVIGQLEDESVYAEAETQIQDQISSQMGDGAGGELPVSVDAGEVADEAITRSYIRNQTNRNLRQFYRYLHGNTDALALSVDLDPVKSSIAEAVGDQAATVNVAELAGDQLENAGGEIPIDAAMVEQLTAGPDGYETARTELRDRLRDRVVTSMVDAAFANASNDELLALVIEDYDPNDYSESEKEQMVADREEAIRTAIREQLTTEQSDEIQAQIDATLEQFQASVEERQPDANGNATQQLEAAIFEVNRVVVTGFTGDASYDAFASELDTTKQELGTAVEGLVADRLDEQLPTTMDLTEEMDSGALEQLETARSAVTTLDLLAIVLPLLGLGLIGLAYVPSRAIPTTAGVAGSALTIAGLVGVLGAVIAGGILANTIRESVPRDTGLPIADIAEGVIDDVFGTLSTQSLVIGAAGIIALVLVVAYRRGLLDQYLTRNEGGSATVEGSDTDDATESDETDNDR